MPKFEPVQRRLLLDNNAPPSQSRRVGMSKKLRLHFLAACACLVFGARIFAAETNPVSSPQTNADMAGAYLQIQAQFRDTQMALASNRLETAAALARNADDMAARIQLLAQAIADQRASDAESSRKLQQFTLALAGTGLLGLLAMLLMVYFQLRAVTRLVELAVSSPALNFGNGRALPVVETGGGFSAPGRTAVESANMKLLGAVERLEKRILEMEQASRAPLAEKKPSNENGSHPGNPIQSAGELIAEGQLFLDANEPEKALEKFEKILASEPGHVEALIKKAGALEKLDRVDEAVACYDRAIEADDSTTIAYLHKGGLYNRMARYDEALLCYEKALKNSAQEKIGAKMFS
jgi:tetratricopeptide (TPR) repeat protein